MSAIAGLATPMRVPQRAHVGAAEALAQHVDAGPRWGAGTARRSSTATTCPEPLRREDHPALPGRDLSSTTPSSSRRPSRTSGDPGRGGGAGVGEDRARASAGGRLLGADRQLGAGQPRAGPMDAGCRRGVARRPAPRSHGRWRAGLGERTAWACGRARQLSASAQRAARCLGVGGGPGGADGGVDGSGSLKPGDVVGGAAEEQRRQVGLGVAGQPRPTRTRTAGLSAVRTSAR